MGLNYEISVAVRKLMDKCIFHCDSDPDLSYFVL